MGSRLPVVSGKDLVAAFQTLVWTMIRQHGSHMILAKSGSIVSLSVPNHIEVARGTLRSLINRAGLSVEEFVDLLNH